MLLAQHTDVLQVEQHAMLPPAPHLYPMLDPHQPMGRGRDAAGGLQRAVHNLESHLRATRQDALQLATAVVRLEKEKAALQRCVEQQAEGLRQTWPSNKGTHAYALAI